MRWPTGVRCLQCGGDKISKFVTNETTRERVNGKVRRSKFAYRHGISTPASNLLAAFNSARPLARFFTTRTYL